MTRYAVIRRNTYARTTVEESGHETAEDAIRKAEERSAETEKCMMYSVRKITSETIHVITRENEES